GSWPDAPPQLSSPDETGRAGRAVCRLAERGTADADPRLNEEGERTMTQTECKQIDAYWRAANYLAAGQLYLLDNPLLRRPLTRDDVKKKIVGHWGTVPGQNFVYVHLNRIIKEFDQDLILISGPGHGGN